MRIIAGLCVLGLLGMGCSKTEPKAETAKTEAHDDHGHSHDHHGHDHGDHGHAHGENKSSSDSADVHAHSHHGHDHGNHSHAEGGSPHHGLMNPFKSGDKSIGYTELKLHDDKGDLELWLTQDDKGKSAYDLTIASEIKVHFPDLKKDVTLKVRNTEKNEDEDGKVNNREGFTNYFIFPGESGEDASWLMGKEFKSNAYITFTVDDVEYKTETFELIPHTH